MYVCKAIRAQLNFISFFKGGKIQEKMNVMEIGVGIFASTYLRASG